MTALEIPTARVFLPALQPSRYKGFYGGRGSGKSHFVAERAVDLCVDHPGLRIVCIREVQKTLKESMKMLIEDKVEKLGFTNMFDCQAAQTVTPGGGVVIYQGMQDHNAESIKSLEAFDIAIIEEARTLSKRSLELLRPTIRSGRHFSEIWAIWNPYSATDPIDKFFRGLTPPPDSILIKANWSDNPFFPDVLEQERLYDKEHNPDRYDHIWEGGYAPQAVGAIFHMQDFHENRRADVPDLKRILIAVDHAISNEEGSDEHGIMVGGLGTDGRGYLLEDASMRGDPAKWARRVVDRFDWWQADAVVIERNQGGDLVRRNLETERPSLPIIEVNATRGKHVRAEPIASLYKNGKVSHVGTFPELEKQYCEITNAGYEGDGSPDRADAAVWLLTELFNGIIYNRPQRKIVDVPRVTHGAGGWMG
jgi:hypothetical protein